MLKRIAGTTVTVAVLLSLCGAPLSALALPAAYNSMQAPATAPTRILGTVTAVGKDTLTIKPGQGNAVTITIGSSTRILRLEPGQKSLSEATPIHLTDISAGDRALVSASSGENNTLTANLVVAMKESDIAARRRAQEEDWQRNGVGGIVKSVDLANHTVLLASATRSITIQVSDSTPIRKYANNSVAFKDTKPSSLSAIKPGDQLRAKGRHSPDGSTVTATAVVFGEFQNIAGLVLSVDPAAKTLTVKDLATKKPVTLSVDAASTLRQLPPRVAEFVAMRLHEMKSAGKSSGDEKPTAEHREYNRKGRPGAEHMGPSEKSGNGFAQVLDRATPIHLSDLHKGDAVMVVASTSTEGKPGTALTLLSGVAPMLRASRKASQSMFSSSWSLGGGQAAEGGSGGEGGNRGGQSTGGGNGGGQGSTNKPKK